MKFSQPTNSRAHSHVSILKSAMKVTKVKNAKEMCWDLICSGNLGYCFDRDENFTDKWTCEYHCVGIVHNIKKGNSVKIKTFF